jgi:hypothetical protein
VRKHNLNDGDVVLIGQHELMYIDERAQKLRAPVVSDAVELPDPAREEA